MTPEFKNKIEAAVISIREAQMEIENDGTTYEQLENMQFALEDILEDMVG